MSKWLERARVEIPKGAPRPTANSDVRSLEGVSIPLTSLLAVSHPDPFAGIATAADEREIRAHLVRVLPGEDHPDYREALALALADPVAALDALRATTAPGSA